jgi:hypothetical protein
MTTRYRLTVGEYEDLCEIGIYDTYDEAVYALGAHVMARVAEHRMYASRPVEYPEIEELRD